MYSVVYGNSVHAPYIVAKRGTQFLYIMWPDGRRAYAGTGREWGKVKGKWEKARAKA